MNDLENLAREAKNAARIAAHQFLHTQKHDAAVHGGGWDARELTRLLVHFWTMGYNTVQSDQSVSAEVDA